MLPESRERRRRPVPEVGEGPRRDVSGRVLVGGGRDFDGVDIVGVVAGVLIVAG